MVQRHAWFQHVREASGVSDVDRDGPALLSLMMTLARGHCRRARRRGEVREERQSHVVERRVSGGRGVKFAEMIVRQ